MSLSSLLPPGVSIFEAEEILIQIMQDTFTANLISAAAATWIAFDICLSFPQEVELVWKARWTFTKVVYIAIRYYGLISILLYVIVNSNTNIPLGLCRGWPYFEGFGATALILFLCDGMFVLRLWCIYENNKKVLVVIVVCYIIEIVASVTVGVLAGKPIQMLPPHPIPGCFSFSQTSLNATLPAWVLICCIATIYLGLMLYQFFKSAAFRSEFLEARRNPIARWSEFRKLSPFVYLLVRDGVLYYVLMFLVTFVNMIITVVYANRVIEVVGIPTIIAISSISASHLALNLRGFIGGERTPNQFDDPDLTSIIELQDSSQYSSSREWEQSQGDSMVGRVERTLQV